MNYLGMYIHSSTIFSARFKHMGTKSRAKPFETFQNKNKNSSDYTDWHALTDYSYVSS